MKLEFDIWFENIAAMFNSLYKSEKLEAMITSLLHNYKCSSLSVKRNHDVVSYMENNLKNKHIIITLISIEC